MREIDAAAAEKAAQGKIARLEAQLFRLNKKADEKEDQAMYVRAQSYVKLRTLFKVGGRPRPEAVYATSLISSETRRKANQCSSLRSFRT